MSRIQSDIGGVHGTCVSRVVRESVLLDSCHRVGLRLLHLESQQLLIQTDQPIVPLGSLLAHLSQASLHSRVLILDPIELNLQVVVLMGNLFDLDGGCDRVAALGRSSQDLVQSLLAARFLLVGVRIVVNRRHIVGLYLRIDLVLEDLLHRASEGPLLDEVAHTCLAVGLPNLQLLV